MKIFLVGNRGMLGSDLINELQKTKHKISSSNSDEIDITKKQDMKKIKSKKPEILINCSAYTNVEKAEDKKEKAYAVNTEGVKNLVNICKEQNIPLIHISTDYVFNGKKGNYDENDIKNPLNVYGKTKSDGEEIIIDNLEKYYIVRTSWLFGKNRKNFVETIINLCEEREEIKVVKDQFGRPTYTKDLSEGIINLIESKKPYGIYHLTNSGSCSWYEFAKEISELKNLECKISPCTSVEFPTKAKRPKSTILNNNKTKELRPWKIALEDYLKL